VKLLLLGAGGSGKSTMFKQMIALYGSGFPEKERRLYIPTIHTNVIVTMQALIAAVPVHGAAVSCQDAMQAVCGLKTFSLDEDMALNLRRLWDDPGIRLAYENSAKFQLMDSARYFLDQVEVLAASKYVPSMQDVLRSRVRTTGIAEQTFSIEGYSWRMFDVGGQRNERRKWIHCFENVTAVIFIGVLSEYDLLLEEDQSKNRMEETLELFEDICNSRYFREASLVLFLNKRDLFADKIKKVPLSACPVFQQYHIEQTYDAGCQAIEQAFLSKRQNPDKLIYVHITCATDTSNIATVFHAVRDTIIRTSLLRAGVVV